MLELNTSIFYKVRFNICSKDNNILPTDRVIHYVSEWLQKKWRYALKDVDLSVLEKGCDLHEKDRSGSVSIKSDSFLENENFLFWACQISEQKAPKEKYAPRTWITEIGIRPLEKGKIEFSCVIYYTDRPGFIGLCEKEPDPNIPKFIGSIIKDPEMECSSGCDTIFIEPTKLSVGDWVSFWDKITDDTRELPYIFISPQINRESGKGQLIIDPQTMAIAAGGNALVFYATDMGIIEEMNYYCPEEYKCYGGAIRIYANKVKLDDPLDSHRHRYIAVNTITELGVNTVVQMIRRALAQDVHFYETFFRLRDCVQKREVYARQMRLTELHQQHEAEKNKLQKENEKETEYWYSEATSEAQKRVQAEEENDLLREEMREIKSENYNLTMEIDSYRPLAAKNAELEKVCKNRFNTKEYPDSVEEVVHYFEAVFADKIAFSDDAYKSLKDCTIPLKDVWNVFFHLATVMCDLYINGVGDIYKEFRNKSGIDISRGEGSCTHQNKKLMKQYVTHYHGESIDIEAHQTYPRIGQSIHFGFSEKDQKVVVGWCGEHKDNATTQKVR